jgi:YggT family protein
MDLVVTFACRLLDAYYIILILRIILSWVPSLPSPLLPVAKFVRALTDPLLLPLRGTIPPVQMGAMALDLSPLILFFGVSIIRRLLCTGV